MCDHDWKIISSEFEDKVYSSSCTTYSTMKVKVVVVQCKKCSEVKIIR